MTIPNSLSIAVADRYAIQREIGRGGMATVFLARDLRHDRAVALKLLDPELGAVLGVDRFLAEIRVTANLQHPNLLPLFDSGEANGQPFYVMPFVDGESLRQRLDREKQLPVDEAIRMTSAVASALEYAHARGVIHRDLKPENILLQAGQPVVADFGIALAVSNAGGARVTQTGLSLGTPQYMSPEQATGDRTIDGRSDIYSLAAVTYEMLTGDPPHTGSTMQAVIARVLTEQPRGVRTVRPAVPEHVAVAVERGLEKLPADRWATARDFADALQGKTVTTPPRGRETSRNGGPALRARSSRTRDPIVLGAITLGLIGVAVGAWGWTRGNAEDTGATVRFLLAPAEHGETLSENTQTAISPNGKLIAYPVTDPSGQRRLAVREVGQLNARIIPGSEGATVAFFSPDGAWLGFYAIGRGLSKVAVIGGPVLSINEVRDTRGACWIRGDVIVASVNDSLMIVPAAGGQLRPFGQPGNRAAGELGQRSPRVLDDDGRTVLYQSWRGSFADSRIGIASVATGKTEVLDIVGASPIGIVDGQLIYGTATGAIMAVPFDISRRRVTGAPVPVIDRVDIGNSGLVRAAVSKSGSLVYVSGTRKSQVVLADVQSGPRVLIDEPRNYSGLRFSPDGTRLALAINDGDASAVWIHDIASSTLTKLTTEGTRSERPAWTPDGKRVLYTSNRERGGQSALWWQNADLSGSRELVEGAEGRTVNAGVVSPDGQYLLFWQVTAGRRADIMYRRLIGDTTRRPFATTADGELSPAFSPDGKWVAYTSSGDGGLHVYVQPFPPTGARYQVTASRGSLPVWSRDGNRIFYMSSGRLEAATIRKTPTFAVVSRARVLTDSYLLGDPPHANYDVSPDGKSFALLRPAGGEDQLIVVHDWKYELRERTRNVPR